MKTTAKLEKMRTNYNHPIDYFLLTEKEEIHLNNKIGSQLRLNFNGEIYCVNCDRKTKKAFGQGFCYPCFMNSPENAECIIRPELCKGHLGEGRDPEWEKTHHVQPHTVYLALSSGIKVGVTRDTQIPTRWIDQGASKAIVLAEVPYRQLAGAIEVDLKNFMGDKTNWQAMLKNIVSPLDLLEEKTKAGNNLTESLKQYLTINSKIVELIYPVEQYPVKVTSINLEKNPNYEGVLKGIKGQYLIFENGVVFNVRNHSGYKIEMSFE